MKGKDILKSVFFLGAGAICFIGADKYVFMLFHVIPVNLRIVAVVFILLGLLNIVTCVKGSSSSPKKKKKAPAPQPAAKAAPRPAAGAAEPVYSAPNAAAQEPKRATRPTAGAQPVRSAPTAPAQEPGRTYAQAKQQRENEEAVHLRVNLESLEGNFAQNPNNLQLVPTLMHTYDRFLRSRGEYTFANYQYRFYAALRAIYKEEQFDQPRTTRRFWVVHSAVHGGIAASKSKDLKEHEAALEMLERAMEFRPEGNRPVDQQYVEMAIPAVRCWVAYRTAKLHLAQTRDHRRASEALLLAWQLFPHQGSLRMCHLNPHLENDTRELLTREQLEALRNQLHHMTN